ncbi:MAG: fibronectin type III domain-containing protein, partial [Prevotellaceae bacterium]|nr:fibronectin type III domain-containing protein [Prevotellaceae bacterium]
MKNLKNLKSWAFAFAICALAAVASCSKDEDNTDNTGTETVAVPTNLSAGSITATTAELSWTSDASQFKIKINDGTYTSAVAKYSAASLTPGTAYTWQVQALKGEAESDWSASSSFTTPAGSVTPPPPATLTTPTNLRIYETVTYYGADFAWDTDALYFELQVISEANDTSKYSGAMTDFSADWYVVNNLQPETNYTWRVRVTNDIAGAEDSFSAWANGSNFTT